MPVYDIRSISQVGTSEPFELQVSRGQIPGHTQFELYALNPDFTNVAETVWENGGVYAYPPAATQMKVVSSDDTDTSTVTIEGLDAEYNQIEETLVITGQTPVLTTQSFLRINYAIVRKNTPTGQIRIGTGTVTAGVPENVYAYINGDNVTLSSVYSVPAGVTLFLDRGTVSVTSDPQAIINVRLMERPFGEVFHTVTIVNALNSYLEFNWDYPIVIPEKSDIECQVRCLKNQTNSATTSLEGVLIKNGGPL
jgi:hypothetical protein